MLEAAKIREACQQPYRVGASYYVGDVPPAKAFRARDSLRVPDPETIIALLDLTILGSAEDAMVISDRGVYWRNWGEPRRKISWPQLAACELRQERGFAQNIIYFGADDELSLARSGQFNKEGDLAILELLMALQKLAFAYERTAIIVEQPAHFEPENLLEENSTDANFEPVTVERPPEIDAGFVTCEFCEGRVKPDVTFCKHCGIKLRG